MIGIFAGVTMGTKHNLQETDGRPEPDRLTFDTMDAFIKYVKEQNTYDITVQGTFSLKTKTAYQINDAVEVLSPKLTLNEKSFVVLKKDKFDESFADFIPTDIKPTAETEHRLKLKDLGIDLSVAEVANLKRNEGTQVDAELSAGDGYTI